SERRRGKDPERVDRVAELDRKWRDTRQKLDELRHERNEVSDRIGEKKQAGEAAEDDIQRMQQVKEKIADLEEKEAELKEERDEERYRVGNILHEAVPPGEDEDDAEELRQWGEKPGIDDPLHHADLVEEFDLVDTDTAGEVAGSRFYYMKDDLVKLHLAVQQFALDTLQEHGFQRMYTPFMLNAEQMEAAAELDDFEETLYGIDEEDKYLIATSEQTLAAYHYDEMLDPAELPLRYAGISACFRKEAGSHGKDTKGIFRVHQFDKVEQFIFAHPDHSWDRHEELIEVAEEIMQELQLHYRVV
ncbi:MAG: serine--tRNA ligase, partial [Candidatus Nanohaloarchaea archaeon]|nr:serine--tRNA ligase [Candidatus Nanohaloarchaea archaeon]